jgi:hypothetical protein
MFQLGYDLDVCLGIQAVNLATAANTGARIHLRNYDAVTVVFLKATGGAGEAPTLTLQEHTAATSGTSQNLAVIEEYYKKEDTTLSGDEAWERVTQAAAATITDADWDDANQVLAAFNVQSQSLSAGYEWISVNIADVGTTAQIGAVLYIPTGLKIQRRPDLLAQPNA